MGRKTAGMNRHQKRARRPGEERVSGEAIEELVDLSRSQDPEDRLVAAQFLCPCHVRRRIEEVWEALYRMLEDPNEKVRRAAWHTLEDGGRPDDPKLTEIFQRAAASEPSVKLRKKAQEYLEASAQDSTIELKLAAQPEFQRVGKCDFCGQTEVRVKEDFETELPSDGQIRFALVCESCDGKSPS